MDDILSDFIENMNALNDSMPVLHGVVGLLSYRLGIAHREYLNKYGVLVDDNGTRKKYNLPVQLQSRARGLSRHVDSFSKSTVLIPRNFLVSFVSEFDCFIGGLLREIYSKRPELLNDSEKKITYSEILSYGSLEEVKSRVLEKEIENVLRKSHSDQFSFMENRFGVKLREGLNVWSEFIEITERRNLFVHANGIVSDQYIKACSVNGCDIGEVKIGDKLSVDINYLSRAYDVLYEIAVKLTHVLWRKLFKDDVEKADNSLNNSSFDLLLKNKNDLAAKILEFSVGMRSHFNETVKRMMVINLAQAYKRGEGLDKCRSLLSGYDWSATSGVFKLAISVLEERYDDAASLLKICVEGRELGEKDVVLWPLFKKFRETEEFLSQFNELFGKDYAEQESIIGEEFDRHMEDMFSGLDDKEQIEKILLNL